MLVALPFAVLEAGGSIQAVGLVVAAQLVPFLVFALAGGVISDRGDRRRVLVASDLARLVVQAVGGILLVTGAATPLMLGVLAAFYGTADAFFQPAFTGLLPQTVSHPGQLQPANALRGLSFSISSIAGPALAGVLIAGPRRGRGDALRRRVLRGQRRLPAAAGAARGGRGDRGRRRPRSSPPSGTAGARCAAARGCSPASAPCARTRASCCPPSTCSARSRSPSASAVPAPGPSSWSPSAWAACSATCCCCASGPRHALLTAGIALILASSQAAVYGAGRGAGGDVRAAVRDRDRRDRVLHPLGGVAAGAHPGRRPLARELVRLPREHHPHAGRARPSSARSPPRSVRSARCWG